MAEWLAMDGYAAFVWPAYLLSGLGLMGLLIWAVRGHRAARREAADVFEAET